MNFNELFEKIKRKFSGAAITDGEVSENEDSDTDLEDILFEQDNRNSRKNAEKNSSNDQIKQKQYILFSSLLIGFLFVTTIAILFLQSKTTKKRKISDSGGLKIELADKALDPEVHWRNYYEEQRERDRKEFEERLKQVEQQQLEVTNTTKKQIEEDLADSKEKLLMAQKELAAAGLALQKVAEEEEARLGKEPPYMEPSMNEIDLNTETEFDQPKSIKNYIPEGTYLNGYLLGGVVVSTALNTADENPTPVSIRLKSRGNLNTNNQLDVSKCRIMGSAYGDLSSERAVVRLEKMICEIDGTYVTSRIAGMVYGPDGFNGIKGSVVSTSEKHLKNAFVGGLISGVTSISKGQGGVSMSAAGVISSQKQDFKDLATGGVLQGASTAGEKLADYYLKQAESMSPVLTIPAGVRVQAHITKGFAIGEVGTIGKIKSERNKSN
ncbi:MAG: hypothetical protein KA998_00160 [Rickettsiaceae bacterium]|nr:hypothetical protein [Rickettsiaceae bacterium]